MKTKTPEITLDNHQRSGGYINAYLVRTIKQYIEKLQNNEILVIMIDAERGDENAGKI